MSTEPRIVEVIANEFASWPANADFGIEGLTMDAGRIVAALAAAGYVIVPLDEVTITPKNYYPFGRLDPDDPIDQAIVNAFNKRAEEAS